MTKGGQVTIVYAFEEVENENLDENNSYRITYERLDLFGIDPEFEITATISDYYPAKVSALPENSYPEEGGEVEITGIWWKNRPKNVSVVYGYILANEFEKLIYDHKRTGYLSLKDRIYENLYDELSSRRGEY